MEYWGDDVPEGQVTSFLTAVQCRDDETVVFFWINWSSKEIRGFQPIVVLQSAETANAA